ncbi:hypothetical protein D3H55_10480 [Bacillus salacetis]|uniref:Uncharacterized protein n=1 Tax=Bacillus salacetis TaxID=2315464 RepID=A0A3A1R1G7_9BACI|nr:hypothetical protein D3H55_10480 [Bacillus salacetis]
MVIRVILHLFNIFELLQKVIFINWRRNKGRDKRRLEKNAHGAAPFVFNQYIEMGKFGYGHVPRNL